MKEQFCTYEIALKLKKLGFDEECFAHFRTDEYHDLMHNCENCMDGDFIIEYNLDIKAPLWQQAVDWFREKHDLSIDVYTISGFSTPYYSWDIISKNNIYEINHFKIGSNKSFYKMRKEAILKAIELCK